VAAGPQLGQPIQQLTALAVLVAVIAVALLGGLVPAVLESIAGSLLLNFYFRRSSTVSSGLPD
jgi:hypothetical protein